MKKYIIFIVVFFFLALVVGIVYNVRSQGSETVLPPNSVSFSKQTPTASLSPAPSSGIRVGLTTPVDLVALLGDPVGTKNEKGQSILMYPTKNKYWNNEYFFQNNTLVFVRERIFPLSKDSYVKRVAPVNGSPTILYGPDARSGILLYVFPNKGVSFLANKDTGFVYEAWTHPQETINNLLTLPQFQKYSLSQTFGKEGVPE